MGGSDLALNPDDHNGKPGKYVADWNTTGISATKRGDREDVLVNLQVGNKVKTCIKISFLSSKFGFNKNSDSRYI